LGALKNYVGCQIEEKENKIIIKQPKLIAHLVKAFGKYVPNKEYVTPAVHRMIVMRPMEDDSVIDENKQSEFRTGVGMLLYLVKHSRPDIANAVRELTKVLDRATLAHWKAMLRVINYVLATKNQGLILNPKLDELIELEGRSDSEYAGDKETRQTVYGYVVYCCGAPIAWRSKSMKSVTLSTTEAEYVATSEVVKELIFAKQLVESIGLKVKLPMVTKVDNVGAIYLTQNPSTSQRTKHIDVRYHFVREFVEAGVVKVEFIKSEENEADIMTKNTTNELFEKHKTKLVG
jgi:hypothetical protein